MNTITLCQTIVLVACCIPVLLSALGSVAASCRLLELHAHDACQCMKPIAWFVLSQAGALFMQHRDVGSGNQAVIVLLFVEMLVSKHDREACVGYYCPQSSCISWGLKLTQHSTQSSLPLGWHLSAQPHKVLALWITSCIQVSTAVALLFGFRQQSQYLSLH